MLNAPTARGAAAYRQVDVQSRSPLELVVLLYDAAIRAVGEARGAIERRDLAAKRDQISRALGIIGELQSSLNMEAGGEIAASLDRLYAFVNERLVAASAANDTGALDECVRTLAPLRSAWAEIAAPQKVAGTGR